MKPPIHVVILNYNRWADTVECLESVLRSTYEDTRAIVVDNGSTDDSVEQLIAWATGARPYQRPSGTLADLSWPPVQKPVDHVLVARGAAQQPASRARPAKVTIIPNPHNEGFAVGNNIALRFLLATGATGYACLINNDMVVSPHVLTELVDVIEANDRRAAVGGVILDYHQPDLVQILGGAHFTRLGMAKVLGGGLKRDRLPAKRELGYVAGGCLLIRVETLRDIDLMDEAFFLYGEDADWGERMRKRGYELAYSTNAFVWHKGGITTVNGSPFQDYHMVRGTLRFVRKHAPRLGVVALGYSILRSLAPKIVRRQWARAGAVLRAYADHVRS